MAEVAPNCRSAAGGRAGGSAAAWALQEPLPALCTRNEGRRFLLQVPMIFDL